MVESLLFTSQRRETQTLRKEVIQNLLFTPSSSRELYKPITMLTGQSKAHAIELDDDQICIHFVLFLLVYVVCLSGSVYGDQRMYSLRPSYSLGIVCRSPH